MKTLISIAIISTVGLLDTKPTEEVEGKYQWSFIGKHTLTFKSNKTFRAKSSGPRVRGKLKGTWIEYQNIKETGIILTYEDESIDTLYIMGNGNLSPNPDAVENEIIIYEKQ